MSRCALALLALLMLAAPPASADFPAGIKAFDAGDHITALRELLPLANAGNVEAQYRVGLVYDWNKGVPRDIEKALDYYERAASVGHLKAQYNLGINLIKVTGPRKSVADGIKWLERAAEAGYLPAMFNLGVYHDTGTYMPVDYPTALGWYMRAAKQNHSSAQKNLGLMYIGGHGTKQDFVEGFKWLFIAEANGAKGVPDLVEKFSIFIDKDSIDRGRAEMLKSRKRPL